MILDCIRFYSIFDLLPSNIEIQSYIVDVHDSTQYISYSERGSPLVDNVLFSEERITNSDKRTNNARCSE